MSITCYSLLFKKLLSYNGNYILPAQINSKGLALGNYKYVYKVH